MVTVVYREKKKRHRNTAEEGVSTFCTFYFWHCKKKTKKHSSLLQCSSVRK